jgi:biopolymer transport protein TolR
MLSQGIKVDLPQAAAEPIEPDDLEPLVLSIDKDGLMYLTLGEQEAPQTEERILEIASAALRREPGRPVLVKADRSVPYGRVVEGMVLLQQSGAKKVGFVTEPLPQEGRRAGQR